MAEAKLTEYMLDGLNKVASLEGFKNYDLQVDHGSSSVDGFIGLIYKVRIQEVGSNKKLDVVLKFPPADKTKRDKTNAMKLFEREIIMYTEILPEFVNFQRGKGMVSLTSQNVTLLNTTKKRMKR